jgi:hypothetical protein
MAKVSAKTREELVQAVGERYRNAEDLAKRRILDEFVQLTGFHRKHAIRVLNAAGCAPARAAAPRSRLYEEGARQAIVVLWEASDRVCGKRLKPLLYYEPRIRKRGDVLAQYAHRQRGEGDLLIERGLRLVHDLVAERVRSPQKDDALVPLEIGHLALAAKRTKRRRASPADEAEEHHRVVLREHALHRGQEYAGLLRRV